MSHINPILATDSYKLSHWLQYPPNTQYVNSYIEARGGGDVVVFFGLQAFLMEYMMKPITMENYLEARAFAIAHGMPFNEKGFFKLVGQHWPVEIEAVPEGTVVPVGNVLVQIRNTHPDFPWVVSFLETALLRAVWYPSTVATNSWMCRKIIDQNLQETADSPETEIDFKMHDFGARGVSSAESAALGGMAHLVNFKGSDTMEGIMAARRYYGEHMAGFSIPAAEHSTITAWGPKGEVDAYRNMLTAFKGSPLVAVVSDSYDIYNAVDNIWGKTLSDDVKDFGGTIVIRPDSGDPLVVPIDVIDILMQRFGFQINSKGYRVLPSYIRVIQGDGINRSMIQKILDRMKDCGLSGSNIAFGQGGGLLQAVTRDTFKFAMKASAIMDDSGWRNINKAPVTDPRKASKGGILALTRNADGDFETVVRQRLKSFSDNLLNIVYRNGELTRMTFFDEVRRNAAAG